MNNLENNQVSMIDRNIYLYGEINHESALQVITAIKYINEYDEMIEEGQLSQVQELVGRGLIKEDSLNGLELREPITLEINSGGGHTSSGFSIISAIENSDTPVIGYVTGDCMSMAIGVLSSCHYRLSSEYARFMIHDIYSITEGKFNDLNSSLKYVEKIRENYKRIIVQYTDIDGDEIDKITDANSDYHFDPEEAKRMKLIDSVDSDEVSDEFILEKLYGIKPQEDLEMNLEEEVSNDNENEEEQPQF